jgi:hypothetical protein
MAVAPLNHRVAKIRRNACVRNGCEFLATLDYSDPCASCPAGHFGPFLSKGCDAHKRGDRIGKIAQPIARAIDKVAGTNITGCGGCKKMKARLNAGVPLHRAIKLRLLGN